MRYRVRADRSFEVSGGSTDYCDARGLCSALDLSSAVGLRKERHRLHRTLKVVRMSSRFKSAEETRAEYLAAMGLDLGPVFHALWNECAWLHLKWREYRELFGGSSERVDLLNSAAGLSFRIIQDSLWEDILLHLCRLTDPPSIGKKENLTVLRLPGMVDAAIRAEVEGAVESLEQRTAFARDWRNRHIAHSDLMLALDESLTPLAPASRAKVAEALSGR